MNISDAIDPLSVADLECHGRFESGYGDLYDLARAIEQAVLQSSEVQGLLNALQEVVNAADGDGWNVLDPSFEKQRAALAAMKKKHEKINAMLKAQEKA